MVGTAPGWVGAHPVAGGELSQPPGVGAELPRGLGGWVLWESSSNRYNGSGEHCHEIKYVRKIRVDTVYPQYTGSSREQRR